MQTLDVEVYAGKYAGMPDGMVGVNVHAYGPNLSMFIIASDSDYAEFDLDDQWFDPYNEDIEDQGFSPKLQALVERTLEQVRTNPETAHYAEVTRFVG